MKREQGADIRRTSSGATNSQPSSDLPKSNSAPSPSAEQGAAPSQPFNPAASLPNPRASGGSARAPSQGQSSQNRAVLGASAANDIFIPSRPPPVQRPTGNGAGMVPPKTGVVARDTMRQLLTDALAKALPDVEGGEPGQCPRSKLNPICRVRCRQSRFRNGDTQSRFCSELLG